jgi:hypothetical protein
MNFSLYNVASPFDRVPNNTLGGISDVDYGSFMSRFRPSRSVSHSIPARVQLRDPDNSIVEHSDDFKIVIVLDESGSMNNISNDMITAINGLIQEQKRIEGRPCRFTLVQFNDKINRKINNLDLGEINGIRTEDYRPNGNTALYDAIGNTINWFRYEKNVLLVIVTDGEENSSRYYNKEAVTSLLEEKKEYRDWTYVYLSNDLSTSKQGHGIGLGNTKHSANCVTDSAQFRNFVESDLNIAIGNYRTSGISVQGQLQAQFR